MAKKRSDYIDVDAFIKALEEIEWEEEYPQDLCPKCGSETWEELYYSKKTGKPNRCNECKSVTSN